MLKNILNIEGTQELSANEQKMIISSNVKVAPSQCETWVNNEDCESYFPIENGYSLSF